MDSAVVKSRQKHIYRITGIIRSRMKNGIQRRPGTTHIITAKVNTPSTHQEQSNTQKGGTHSLPVAGKVLNFGNELSTSNNANSRGKSAFSKAAALEGCTSGANKSCTEIWPAASCRYRCASLLSVKLMPHPRQVSLTDGAVAAAVASPSPSPSPSLLFSPSCCDRWRYAG